MVKVSAEEGVPARIPRDFLYGTRHLHMLCGSLYISLTSSLGVPEIFILFFTFDRSKQQHKKTQYDGALFRHRRPRGLAIIPPLLLRIRAPLLLVAIVGGGVGGRCRPRRRRRPRSQTTAADIPTTTTARHYSRRPSSRPPPIHVHGGGDRNVAIISVTVDDEGKSEEDEEGEEEEARTRDVRPRRHLVPHRTGPRRGQCRLLRGHVEFRLRRHPSERHRRNGEGNKSESRQRGG